MAMFYHTTIYVRTDGNDTYGGSRDSTTTVCTGTTGNTSILQSGVGAQATTAEKLIDTVTPATFQTNGVQVGDFVDITASGDPDNIGSRLVVAVDSETQLEVDNRLDADAAGITYAVGFKFEDLNGDFVNDGVVAGDIMYISAGTGVKVGRYKIIAVDSGTVLRLSYNPGSSGGAGDIEYAIGGAVVTMSEVLEGTTSEDCIAHPGDTVSVKAGTYNEKISFTWNRRLGTIYDGALIVEADGAVVIDAQSTRDHCIEATTSANYGRIFRGKTAGDTWELKNATSHGIDKDGAGYQPLHCFDMKVHDCGANGIDTFRSYSQFVNNCEFYNNTIGFSEYVSTTYGGNMTGCRCYNNTDIGAKVRSHGYTMSNNLFYDNTNDGIWIYDNNCTFRNNTVYSNGKYGVRMVSSLFGDSMIYNNIIAGHNGGGDAGLVANNAGTRLAYLDYNCWHDNTTDLVNIANSKGGQAVEADPDFVNAPADLSLNVGSPCIDAGRPGSNEFVDMKVDIGAHQTEEKGGETSHTFVG